MWKRDLLHRARTLSGWMGIGTRWVGTIVGMAVIGLDHRMWALIGLDRGMTALDSMPATGMASVDVSNTTTGGIAITTAIIITKLVQQTRKAA